MSQQDITITEAPHADCICGCSCGHGLHTPTGTMETWHDTLAPAPPMRLRHASSTPE